jgi:hypothetical protein
MKGQAEQFEISARTFRFLAEGAPPGSIQILNGALVNLSQAACAIFSSTPVGLLENGHKAQVQMRVTVLSVGRDRMRLPAARLHKEYLGCVGKFAGRLWMEKEGNGSIIQLGPGQWERTYIHNEVKNKEIIRGDLSEGHLLKNRIKFSTAYLGGSEIVGSGMFDVWTYEPDEGSRLIAQAFDRIII